tara:strand:+ start:3159 stop:3293 length:135 start_codon:yes stop_codon:yes gene_type:complete
MLFWILILETPAGNSGRFCLRHCERSEAIQFASTWIAASLRSSQ